MTEQHAAADPPERVVRPFAELLREIRRGDLHDELGETLADVVEAVSATGKAGSITVKLTIRPEASKAIKVVDDVKAAIPRAADATMFFAHPGGQLRRSHPDQMTFDTGPRIVDTSTGEITEPDTDEEAG